MDFIAQFVPKPNHLGVSKLQDAWKKVDLNLGAVAWAKEVLGKEPTGAVVDTLTGRSVDKHKLHWLITDITS